MLWFLQFGTPWSALKKGFDHFIQFCSQSQRGTKLLIWSAVVDLWLWVWNSIVACGHTPFHERGRGSGNFSCSTGIHLLALHKRYSRRLTKQLLVVFIVDLSLSCVNSTHVTEYYYTVICPTLYRVAEQTSVKEVTRPFPSLAEWGVAKWD